MQLWPVYVVSSKRAGAITPEILVVAQRILIEPAQYDAYRSAYPDHHLTLLRHNGRGVAYARNGARQAAIDAGHPWFWILDDDLALFSILNTTPTPVWTGTATPGLFPCHATTPRWNITFVAEVLRHAQKRILTAQNVGLACIWPVWKAAEAVKERGHQRPNSSTLLYNRRIYCCTAVNLQFATRAAYREEFSLMSDTDYTLQALASGWNTAVVTDCSYTTARIGTQQGGLQKTYQRAGEQERMSEQLRQYWPDIVTPGYPFYRIHWDRFPVTSR